MADTGKKTAWSEGEKMSLLLQIIKQQGGGENMKIKWNDIHLPGRTPKSMTHVWAKIRSEAASFDAGDVAPVTPRKRAAPKAKAANGEDASESLSPTKKKAGPRKKKAAAKTEDSDHDDAADMADVHDSSGDEIKAKDSADEENFEDV